MTEKEIWDWVYRFLKDHDLLLTSMIKSHLIPNRYSISDVKQYIATRIAEILRRRHQKDGNQINNPVNYFRSCLIFYCREYQRENGYVFCLPRRPRKYCEDEDLEARSRKYKYLDLLNVDETSSLSITETEGPEPGSLWHALTGHLTDEQALVVDCVIRRNMTWSETSQHLKIPQSTCWFRKQQAFLKLFQVLDGMSGQMSENIQLLLRGNEDSLQTFSSGCAV